MLLKSHVIGSGRLGAIVEAVSAADYQGNVSASVETLGHKRSGFHTRFTLSARSGQFGARRSATGRNGPWASWEAHRDVMRAIFREDPAAVLVTGLRNGVTYRGADDFEDKFEDTGDVNVGSIMRPVTMRELTV